MAPESKPQNQRKSIRQSLRDLLTCRRRRTQVDQPRFIGSGILRKADPATPLLPAISSVSLFPDFESSAYDANQFSISIPTSIRDFTYHRDTLIVSDHSVNNSTASLLPVTRLSQLNLHQSFVNKASSPKRVQYGAVPEILIGGASRQASFESYVTSAGHSSSTLRLQSSLISLDSFHTESETVASPRKIGLGIRKSKSRQELPAAIRNLGKPLEPRVQGTRPTRPGLRHSVLEPKPAVTSATIKHFSSFCVLDTLAPGCPVTATSEDLRYIFDVGEPFFLHNQECEGTSFDIVTGHDAAGAEITHLVLFSPLVSPSSGRSRFLLAALIDVTTFLKEAATLPDLETISEASFEDEELPTPRRPTLHPPWTDRGYELSAEDLLGGCFVDNVTGNTGHDKSHNAPFTDDIWLKLATEEKKKSSSSRGSRSSPASPVSFGSVPSASTASSAVDTVLEEFMSSLQQLYSEFFILAKSPLDDHFYEICNVSPSVSASRDYVYGHLSHTPAYDIASLSEQLASDAAFSLLVRWGSKGQERRLYCIPLFGQSSITWICMLVDVRIDSLW